MPNSSRVSSDFSTLRPSCSQIAAWLHQMVGYGRFGESKQVVLKLSTAPDFERPPILRRITLTLEGQPVWLWVSEAALLEWLEPVFAAPDIESLASDMQKVALAWTLAPWLDWCASHHLPTPSIGEQDALQVPMPLEESVPLALSLTSVDEEHPRHLTLYLQGFSVDWLHRLAQSLDIVAPAVVGQIEGYAMVGLSKLTVAQLRDLEIGDVVMFWWQANLKEGGVWLTFTPTSLIGYTRGLLLRSGRKGQRNQFEVESVMEDYEEEQEGRTSLVESDRVDDTQDVQDEELGEGQNILDTLPITLTFEMGRMSLPLSTLTTLQVGDMLDAQFTASPEIGIRAQGRLIASAKLVQIEDRLGAKITRLLTQ